MASNRNSDDVFDRIRQCIFRVQVEWPGDGRCATAFSVARVKPSGRLVLATAAHVLDIPTAEPVKWTVQQFDEGGRECRALSFEMVGPTSGDAAYRWHKEFDVGVIVLPVAGPDGHCFARPDDSFASCIERTQLLGEGTPVAWAGFPAIVEEWLKRPQLCYFEGTICATINEEKQHLYIVDGHSAKGVSGGPLWRWSAQRSKPEVVGIMSQYRFADDGLPGFCVFEPINHVQFYLEWWQSEMNKG